MLLKGLATVVAAAQDPNNNNYNLDLKCRQCSKLNVQNFKIGICKATQAAMIRS
jgi:hypothetical protein